MDKESRSDRRTSNRKGKSKSQVRSDETDRSEALQRSASNGDTRYQKRNSQRSKSFRRSNTIQQGSTEHLETTSYNPCVTGPDIYTNVLGPTADETILVGLETFMKFCQERSVPVDSSAGLSSSEEESEGEVEDGLTEEISEVDRSNLQQDSDQSLTADEHFETSQVSFDKQHDNYPSSDATPRPTLESSRKPSSKSQRSTPSTTSREPSGRTVPGIADRDSSRKHMSIRETTSRESAPTVRESSLRSPISHSSGTDNFVEEGSGKEFGRSISATRNADGSRISTPRESDGSRSSASRETDAAIKGADGSRLSAPREADENRLSSAREADGIRLSDGRVIDGSRQSATRGSERSRESAISGADGSRLSAIREADGSRQSATRVSDRSRESATSAADRSRLTADREKDGSGLSAAREADKSRLSAIREADGSRQSGTRVSDRSRESATSAADRSRLAAAREKDGSGLSPTRGADGSRLSAIREADGSRLSSVREADGSRLSSVREESATRGADGSRLSAIREADGSRLYSVREEDRSRMSATRGADGSSISASRKSGREADESGTAFRESVKGSIYKEDSHGRSMSGKEPSAQGTIGNISDRKSPSRDLSSIASPGKEMSRISPTRAISEKMENVLKPGSTIIDSGRNTSAKDMSQRTISERGSAYRGNGSKRMVSIIESLSGDPTETAFSAKKSLKESTSRELTGRSATTSRVSSKTAARQSGKLAKVSKEQSIPEEQSDTLEKDSDERLMGEVGVEDEEVEVDFNAEDLSTRCTSSRIKSEYSRPSTRTSEQQSDSPSSSRESQTGIMQEVGSSQTSEHSLTTGSQTGETSSSREGHMATTRRACEVQVYRTQTEDDQLGKDRKRTKLSQGSTDTCSCCACTQSRDSTSSSRPTVRINVCKCTMCKKQVQKAAVRRSCLKTSKCKCCAATAATIKSSNNIPQQRQVKMHCECCASVADSEPSESIDQSTPSQMGDTSDECNSSCYKVRYAITKITKFYSYTTFEVMRSTSKQPKVMPKSLEGVFVLKNGASKSGSFEVA